MDIHDLLDQATDILNEDKPLSDLNTLRQEISVAPMPLKQRDSFMSLLSAIEGAVIELQS